jgi:hypothetical protein
MPSVAELRGSCGRREGCLAERRGADLVQLFPSRFAGFAFSAIAIGTLVPAAVMSIGAANLFIWKSYVDPWISHAEEGSVAKITALVVKVGALA